MSEKSYKIIVLVLIGVVLWSILKPSRPKPEYNVNVTTMVAAADGLDLQAVGALVKKAKNAEHLEKLLNDVSQGINNLDLNEDGEVDYIKVTEFGETNAKGFSLTTEPVRGEEQEIATILIEKTAGDKANVEIQGNRQVYGANHYYQSFFPLTSFLLWSYLWSPHPFYTSPWSFGHYPTYYRPYPVANVDTYRSRAKSTAQGSNMRKSSSSKIASKIQSPNRSKSATSIKAPLKNPSQSQKSFQVRNPSKHVRSGGFGRKSPTAKKASVRRSSWSRSGGFSRGK